MPLSRIAFIRLVIFATRRALLAGFALALGLGLTSSFGKGEDDLEKIFLHPPAEARPRVLWMWMGSNITRSGITRDLEALRDAGFGGASMFSLADVCTPWAATIHHGPTPDIVAFSEPWWHLVHFAAQEAARLGLDFGMHNCAGYESSGGPWIPAELSMQQLVWSSTPVIGGTNVSVTLRRVEVDPRGKQPFPVVNPATDRAEKPVSDARQNYYVDVAVLALPAQGVVSVADIIDLSGKMAPDGRLEVQLPAGEWMVYRFGRTSQGKIIQPSQWEAKGLECDKMNAEAITFHLNHVIGQVKQYLGEEMGRGFTHLHFDSYESGEPNWTLKMPEEFKTRRGYDLVPWLAVLAGRTVQSESKTERFKQDFKQTIRDLYEEIYYPTLARVIHAAGLELCSEPYGGPWNVAQVVAQLDRVMGEFWTDGGRFTPFLLDPLLAGARAANTRIIEAEAFTGKPAESEWSETPAWLKPIGDAAFTHGINRLVLHHFAHQPWEDTFQPGVAMGQWGTHFGRYQTWWKPGKAWVAYLARCQALLQWGTIARSAETDFSTSPDLEGTLRAIHRHAADAEIYFVANGSTERCTALCSFAVLGKIPELWNPVSGARRALPDYVVENGHTLIPLEFAAAESSFIVFRKLDTPQTAPAASPRPKAARNFPTYQTVSTIDGGWDVTFNSPWGGPSETVRFESLQDWISRPEPSIRYFSGTAIYQTSFNLSRALDPGTLALDLGQVHHLARVVLNGRDLGVVWTAPWRLELPPDLVHANGNQLKIEVTNVWANRLIGDEQEPADCLWNPGFFGHGGYLKEFPDWFLKRTARPASGRRTFTTWNYFTKESPLVSSGLLGPVTLIQVRQ